ncbi:MAG: hypothetical protein JWN03_8269 [Nocardia sp.]|uniref:hypothetical protein n=1 Tax=Nocardia sp. TaxID=1821 RepID=UPI002614013F|nr:hypothetical protein [Nocardia sp.]MCU1647994.1 hypothetical protein [Nocardia sp.]
MPFAYSEKRCWTGRSAAAALVLLVAATTAVLVVNTGTAAGQETPAQRCARETSAYNSAWESTWRASNPGNPGPPPPPPVPYVCVDPGTAPSTTTTAPQTAPGLMPTQAPGGGVEGQAGNAPGRLPDGNGTDIVPGPSPAAAPAPTTISGPTTAPIPLPTRPVRETAEASRCGVDWHGPPCADLQDCPPGYALVNDASFGEVCFQVEVVEPSYGDRSQVAGGHTTGSLPVEYSETVTATASDTVSGSVTKTDGTTQTVGGGVETGASGGVSIPFLADAEASAKITGSYSWAGNSQQAETTGQSTQYTTAVTQAFKTTVPACTQFTVTPEYALLHWRMAQRYSWKPMGEGDLTHATGRMKTYTDPIPAEKCNK